MKVLLTKIILYNTEGLYPFEGIKSLKHHKGTIRGTFMIETFCTWLPRAVGGRKFQRSTKNLPEYLLVCKIFRRLLS